MAFVELSKLSKRYGAATVVDGIDLAIEKGALVCLLGPSGCGKTTTLRLIAGFVDPSGGAITVGGKVLSSAAQTTPPERRNMSMIFQSYALWPHMSVFDNVAYGLKLRRLARADIKRRVEQILTVTKLAALAERFPAELSGGQQQRVSLARALVVEPETLLLDEPLSNLDANLREEMRYEIRRLHDEYRTTTVYVTHDQSEAMTTADLIVIMNQGRIEQAGSPETIYKRPVSEFVANFIGGANILKGKQAGDALLNWGGVDIVCGAGALVGADGKAAVSVRHHDIRLLSEGPTQPSANWADGKVSRQVFFGSHRDYLVELKSGATVRVVTPPDTNIPPGQAVWLFFPPERCWGLAS